MALGLQRKVDHHDAVLFDDADQHHDTNRRDQCEVLAEDHQSS